MPSILSFCDSGCWGHQLSWIRCSVSHHLGWSRELLSPSCFPFPLCCYASGSLHQVNVDWHNLKRQVCTKCIWLILGSRNLSWSPWVLWSDEERVNMLDGCHHVYLDMGTNTGVQIRFNILGIDSWVYTNKGSSLFYRISISLVMICSGQAPIWQIDSIVVQLKYVMASGKITILFFFQETLWATSISQCISFEDLPEVFW